MYMKKRARSKRSGKFKKERKNPAAKPSHTLLLLGYTLNSHTPACFLGQTFVMVVRERRTQQLLGTGITNPHFLEGPTSSSSAPIMLSINTMSRHRLFHLAQNLLVQASRIRASFAMKGLLRSLYGLRTMPETTFSFSRLHSMDPTLA